MRFLIIAGGLSLGVLGCAPLPTPVPLPGIASIAVLPPSNRSDADLTVAGGTALETYAFGLARSTVGDVLASEAGLQLDARGFSVVGADTVASAAGDSPMFTREQAAEVVKRTRLADAALWMDIRRWEADASFRPAFVLVAIDATIVDVDSGAVLWKTTLPLRPVATQGVVVLGDAYVVAAQKAAQQLFEGLAHSDREGERPPQR